MSETPLDELPIALSTYTPRWLSLTTSGGQLEEPHAGLTALWASAQSNIDRVRRGEPLAGHVLPYVVAEEAKSLRLPFSPEHGWLDNLEGGAGALPEHYAHRYL